MYHLCICTKNDRNGDGTEDGCGSLKAITFKTTHAAGISHTKMLFLKFILPLNSFLKDIKRQRKNR